MNTQPRLSRCLPAVLACFLVADAGTRFIPLDLFAFRAWEVMIVGRGPTGPFAPSRRFVNPWSYGDLPNLIGRPDLREYRREEFSTDDYGFRNPPGLARGDVPVAAIVNGDSFAVGCGVPDRDTLAAQLGALLGTPVYNAAGEAPAAPEDLVNIAARLRLVRRLAIHVYVDRFGLPPPGQDPPRYTTARPGQFTLRDRVHKLTEDLSISRVRVAVNRVIDAWIDPIQVPGNAFVSHLDGLHHGKEILMLPKDFEATYAPMRGAAYFPWLRSELAAHQIDLLVVLAPNKYTVYEPLLAETDSRRGRQPLWMEELHQYLRDQGVQVVDLTPTLRARAAAELQRGRTLYWRDDSHWNGAGIRVAAEEIARRLR
jgi:SGNH hydrolase-like domain, acetyltransferase AlgX